jgi:hypothetical protein
MNNGVCDTDQTQPNCSSVSSVDPFLLVVEVGEIGRATTTGQDTLSQIVVSLNTHRLIFLWKFPGLNK